MKYIKLEPSKFSLSRLSNLTNTAKTIKIDQVKITIKPETTPEDFVHYWDATDIDTVDEWEEVYNDTFDIAEHRIDIWAVMAATGGTNPNTGNRLSKSEAEKIVEGKMTIPQDWQKKANEWKKRLQPSFSNPKKINKFEQFKKYENSLVKANKEFTEAANRTGIPRSMFNKSVSHLLEYIRKNNPSPSRLRSHFTTWAGKEFGKSMLFKEPGSRTNRIILMNSLPQSGFIQEFKPGKRVKTTEFLKDLKK